MVTSRSAPFDGPNRIPRRSYGPRWAYAWQAPSIMFTEKSSQVESDLFDLVMTLPVFDVFRFGAAGMSRGSRLRIAWKYSSSWGRRLRSRFRPRSLLSPAVLYSTFAFGGSAR